MEKQLEKCIDEVCSAPGVSGVICADKQGLCMASKGIAQPKACGVLTSLAKQAALLEPNNKPPVIQLDGKKLQVLVHSTDSITIGIYKTVQ